LCFSYGFTEFDEPSNTYDFALYYQANAIPTTAGNQMTFSSNMYAVDDEGKPITNSLDYTGFEQLMTTAVYSVLTVAKNKSDIDFQVAYLPMNTGEFALNSKTFAKLLIFGTLMIISAGIG